MAATIIPRHTKKNARRPASVHVNLRHPLAYKLKFAAFNNIENSPFVVDSSIYKNNSLPGNVKRTFSFDLNRWVFDNEDVGVRVYGQPQRNFEILDYPVSLHCFFKHRYIAAAYQPLFGLSCRPGVEWTALSLRLLSYSASTYRVGFTINNVGYDMGYSLTDDGKYHALTLVAPSAEDQRLYIDGNLVKSNNSQAWSTTYLPFTWIINGFRVNTGNNNKCDVADPMIWARELSMPEVRKLSLPENVMYDGLLEPAARWYAFGEPLPPVVGFAHSWGYVLY